MDIVVATGKMDNEIQEAVSEPKTPATSVKHSITGEKKAASKGKSKAASKGEDPPHDKDQTKTSSEFETFLSEVNVLIKRHVEEAVNKTIAALTVIDPNNSEPSTSQNTSPPPAKKQRIAPGFNTLHSEDDSEDDDNDAFGVDLDDDEDVDYFSSFFKKEDTLEKYKRPSNINNLITPELNSEFLRLTSLRASDKRLAFVQKLIGYSLCAALSLCQALYNARKAKSEIATKNIYFNSLDVVTMLITSFTNATRVRQDAVQSVLDPRYKKVCATAVASDGLLFGGDFQKQLKEVKDDQKVSPLAFQSKNFVSPLRWGGGKSRFRGQFKGQNINSSRRNRYRYRVRGQSRVPMGSRGSRSHSGQNRVGGDHKESPQLDIADDCTVQLQADTISVSGNPICLPVILNREDNYVAGKLSHFIREWEKYTDDPWILGLIAGVKVEFIASPPGKRDVLREYQFSSKDSHDLHQAILELERFKIVHRVQHTNNEFLSNIMGRRKKDGSMRCILNLSQLNEYFVHDKIQARDSEPRGGSHASKFLVCFSGYI